jgi:hypothetical protein
MKHFIITIIVLTSSTSVVHADLRYTTHVEVRLTPVSTGSNPGFTQIATLLQAIAPAGDSCTYLSRDAARVEASMGMGSVILFRQDGPVMLDPATRTYWRMPALRAISATAAAAPATFRRTGEFSTILGLRAERVVFTTSLPLPVAIAGFPSMLTMEGELWVANAHTAYAKSLSRVLDLAMASGAPEGFVLRQTMRNVQFGYEIEFMVTDVAETPVPTTMFAVPEGYREVSAPVNIPAPKL